MSRRGIFGAIVASAVLLPVLAEAQERRAQQEDPQPGGFAGAFGGDQPAPERLPVEGTPNNAITGALDGAAASQAIGDPAAEIQLLILPQSDEVMIGVPFRFAIRIVGDPMRPANNVRVRLGAKLRRANGSFAPAGEVTFTRAVVLQPSTQALQNCSAAAADRMCILGDLAPGGDARVSGELRTVEGAQPGDLVLTVLTRIGPAEVKPHETILRLVPGRELSAVGLTVDVSRDADVIGMGMDVEHAVTVTNGSVTEQATRTVLDIQQRAVAQSDGPARALAADGMQVTVADQRCVPQNGFYRCFLGTLDAGHIVRIPVQIMVLKDLPGQRSGKIETQARVKSAEIDPDPDNNYARQTTTLLSRQPRLAFLVPVTGPNGQVRFVEQDVLPSGGRFGIGARFMHALMEPETEEIVVRVTVNGGEPIEVLLRKPLVGRAPVYRSAPLRLLPAAAPAPTSDEMPVRASNGDELRVTYERSSAPARVLGTR